MGIEPPVLRQHFEYTIWATRRLVETAAGLTPEQLNRDFGHADRSVLGTLAHIYAADRIWLGRIEGAPPARFLDPDRDLRMEALTSDWPEVHQRWLAWLDSQDASSLEAALQYRDLKGNPHATPLWQVVLHVVNHASHHRGQVSAMLRAMGRTPPPVDLIVYYRSLGLAPE
jgi:uncharacterized damage-inducible protein DinB